MGLVGSLEDLSLLDILQIVNVSKRTGVLKLKPREEIDYFIYFKILYFRYRYVFIIIRKAFKTRVRALSKPV
ncbi:MAG: DUF4388 domain-containing protein [Acidobacteria bacterium]|nr:DUF4388 domain-containing protein [Acidobacteriota bacterium]